MNMQKLLGVGTRKVRLFVSFNKGSLKKLFYKRRHYNSYNRQSSGYSLVDNEKLLIEGITPVQLLAAKPLNIVVKDFDHVIIELKRYLSSFFHSPVDDITFDVLKRSSYLFNRVDLTVGGMTIGSVDPKTMKIYQTDPRTKMRADKPIFEYAIQLSTIKGLADVATEGMLLLKNYVEKQVRVNNAIHEFMMNLSHQSDDFVKTSMESSLKRRNGWINSTIEKNKNYGLVNSDINILTPKSYEFSDFEKTYLSKCVIPCDAVKFNLDRYTKMEELFGENNPEFLKEYFAFSLFGMSSEFLFDNTNTKSLRENAANIWTMTKSQKKHYTFEYKDYFTSYSSSRKPYVHMGTFISCGKIHAAYETVATYPTFSCSVATVGDSDEEVSGFASKTILQRQTQMLSSISRLHFIFKMLSSFVEKLNNENSIFYYEEELKKIFDKQKIDIQAFRKIYK